MNARWIALAVLIAGCSSNDNNGPKDMGVMDMSAGDLSLPMNVLTGQKVLSGTFTLIGVTSDDFAAVTDASGKLQVVPLAGGTPTTVDAASAFAETLDNLVLSWSNLDPQSGAGTLTVWSMATGVKQIAQNSSPFFAQPSSDDAHLMYTDGTAADGSAADYYVAKVDGTQAVKMLSQKSVDFQTCAPDIRSAGTSFFVSACDPGGDAGVSPRTLYQIDAAGASQSVISANVQGYDVSADGSKYAVVTDTNSAFVGSSSGKFDLTDMVAQARLVNSGASVLYVTTNGALKRIDVGATTATTLQAMGVTVLEAISNDEKWAIYATSFDQNAGTNDLYVSSTMTAGAPVTLDAQPTAILFGDAFTDDGSQALYFTNLDVNLNAGDFNATPTAGGMAQALGSRVWVDLALSGAKVVYNDNWMSVTMGMNQTGRADVKVVDLSKGASPTVIADRADEFFTVDSARDKIIYTFSESTDKAGLYVAPVP